MNYITTTELRTESKNLIAALLAGKNVNLVHRSQIVGVITPKQPEKVFSRESMIKIQKAAEALNLPALSYKERERRYRKHLMEKYGKHLS